MKRMVIFDTCASGGALKLNKQESDPFSFRGALENVGKKPGVFMIAAAGADDKAQEVDQLGHGLFTYSLLAAAGATDIGRSAINQRSPRTQGKSSTYSNGLAMLQGPFPA